MEETSSTTITTHKSTQELAIDGQKHLEDTMESAFQILSSLNDELCNPQLWSSSSPHTNGDATSSDATHQLEIGGGALDDARLRYKSSVAVLRSVLTAIPNSKKAKGYDDDDHVSMEELDVEQLEDQASGLRKELEDKNKHLKILIDQLRELVADVSTWQSPVAG